MSRDHQEVIDFWFGELSSKDWFKGGDAVDLAIKERFGELIDQVYAGEYDHWCDTATGHLACIIVLDQFPRNIYRGEARSFSYDDKALRLALEGVSNQVDHQLDPHQRVFFYLPLEHSEVMEDQDLSLERFAHLVTRVEANQAEEFRRFLHYAWRHYEIIKRFGRYPHRNDILGRESTGKEVAFLQQPGSSFL